MHVWAIANQKGGVGKTTSVVCLAGLLGDAGRKVLVVDLDPHGSMSSYFGYDPDELEHSVFDLFVAESAPTSGAVHELMLPSSHDLVQLLPASTALATLDRRNAGRGGMGLVLRKALACLGAEYDYVLIDSPPLLGISLINALASAEQLILPVQTEFLAVKGLERMLNTLKMVAQSLRHEVDYLIVPTMYDRRTSVANKVLYHLRDQYGQHLWRRVIPVDSSLRNASQAGLVPSRYEGGKGRALDAYRRLLDDLQSEQPCVYEAADVQ